MQIQIRLLALLLSLFFVLPAHACGPRFYQTILDTGIAILYPPESSFDFEIAQMNPEDAGPLPGGLKLSETVQAQENRTREIIEETLSAKPLAIIEDSDGLRTRMAASSSDFARDVAEVSGLIKAPDQLETYRNLRAMMLLSERQRSNLVNEAAAEAMITNRNWPDFLPQEFHFYLSGAADFSEKKYDQAIANFRKLLALPREERRFRSTWAAYLMGRSELAKGDEDLQRSRPLFQQVLKEREAGGHDALGLGWDALGIEADFLEMSGSLKEARKAFRYRFALAWEGEGKMISTMRDFRYRARNELETDHGKLLGMDDPFVRQVLTAAAMNAVSEVKYWEGNEAQESFVDGWLEFLGEIELTASEAPRAANFAYRRGSFEAARNFLKAAPKGNPTAIWLEAKLAAKDKQFRTATRKLASAESEFSRPLDAAIPQFDDEWRYQAPLSEIEDHRTSQFWGNRGILLMSTNQFVPAMDAFLRSGHWRDAAYVAEQLISREQLLTYVRDRWPTHESAAEMRIPSQIRYLAARRLARDRYFKDARGLFPEVLVPIFDVYVENYRAFRDESKPETERAKAGWAAAQIHRRLGLELFGTEVGPDYACFGGNYGWFWFSITAERQKVSENSRIQEKVEHFRNPKVKGVELTPGWESDEVQLRLKKTVFPPVTSAEKWAFRHYAKLPNVYRWHYRHVAADLAWEAAALLPDNTEEKAQMINIGGSWIAGRHPEEADFFYKNLVRKNRNTPTGHLADMRRWFVDNHWWDEYDPWIEHELKKPEKIFGWNW